MKESKRCFKNNVQERENDRDDVGRIAGQDRLINVTGGCMCIRDFVEWEWEEKTICRLIKEGQTTTTESKGWKGIIQTWKAVK